MTNTITYDGVEYRKVSRKAEVGELVYVISCAELPELNFKIGVCTRNSGYSSANSIRIDIPTKLYGQYGFLSGDHDEYLVLEPIESVEASPSVIELLSNLALRLTKVEADIKPKEADAVVNDRPTKSDTFDNVNSPQHYRHGRFETIELIEDITKKYDDGFVAYCVGNAVKYVDRAPFKHGSPSEDLRKAAWYLTRAAEHTDAQ